MPERRALIAVLFAALLAAAGGPARGAERPAYRDPRFSEDWRELEALPAADRDFFDCLKLMPAGGAGTLTLGGSLRERVESWRGLGFGEADPADDVFFLTRLLFHADYRPTPFLRLYGEFAGAAISDDFRNSDEDNADLQNLFLELAPESDGPLGVSLRAGRQELDFGRRRLVGAHDWVNVRPAFDGAALTLDYDSWALTGFWTRPVWIDPEGLNEADEEVQFYGCYAAGELGTGGPGLDLYWLGLQQDYARFNGTVGEENRQTLGARLRFEVPDLCLDFDLEAAWQFGELNQGGINAQMAAVEVGWLPATCPFGGRVFLGADYASGDKESRGDVETFNQLFPAGHEFLGGVDVVGRQNIIALRGGVEAHPIPGHEPLTGRLEYHVFRLASDQDALYGAAGTFVRGPGRGSSSANVGSELDVGLSYALGRHARLAVGYCHLFCGDFLEENSGGDDINLGYLSLEYMF